MLLLALAGCAAPDGPRRHATDASASGELLYASWIGDSPWCDFTIGLEAYSESPVCVGCSFSFDVRAEATDTRGADDCVPDPRYSFLDGWEDVLFEGLRYNGQYIVDGWDRPYPALYSQYRYFGYEDYYWQGPGWYRGSASLGAAGFGLLREGDRLEWEQDWDPVHADLLHDPVVADRIRISGWLELDQHYETAP